MALERGELIEHFKLPVVHRVTVKDVADGWSNSVLSTQFTFDILEGVTIQSPKADDLAVLEGGLSNTRYFTIYCSTQMYAALNGTDLLPSAIYIPDQVFARDGVLPPVPLGGFFTVVRECGWYNRIQAHGKYIVCKDTTPDDQSYPVAAAEEVNELITSTDDLTSSLGWGDTWLANNED